jgi:biopolymer transport protein ExbD
MSKFKKGGGKKEAPAVTTASLPDIVFMLLCFFIVITKMRETDLKVMAKPPKITELAKIENKALNSSIFIGPPSPKYQGTLGKAPRLQLNDAFAEPNDIMQWAANRRAEINPGLHPKMTVSMKVDNEVKMGIVNETKTELRKANLRQLYYLANKKSK